MKNDVAGEHTKYPTLELHEQQCILIISLDDFTEDPSRADWEYMNE